MTQKRIYVHKRTKSFFYFLQKEGEYMPYIWTHIVFGDEICKRVNKQPKEEKLYHFGCQGPDFYFFYRFWPWLQSKSGTRLGDLFHTQHCGEVLLTLIKKAKETPCIQDYIAGFITHHILDRTTHPYIHYHAGYKKYKHQHLESILDTLIAKELRTINTEKTPVVPYIDFGKNLPNEVATALTSVASEFYPDASKDFPQEEYHRAYRDMKAFFNFTFDPTGIKNALTCGYLTPFRFTQKFPHKDYLNVNHNQWLHPAVPDEVHTESFWDLWEQALNDATTILRDTYAYWENQQGIDSLVKLIGNISYDNGKECALGLENKICNPLV